MFKSRGWKRGSIGQIQLAAAVAAAVLFALHARPVAAGGTPLQIQLTDKRANTSSYLINGTFHTVTLNGLQLNKSFPFGSTMQDSAIIATVQGGTAPYTWRIVYTSPNPGGWSSFAETGLAPNQAYFSARGGAAPDVDNVFELVVTDAAGNEGRQRVIAHADPFLSVTTFCKGEYSGTPPVGCYSRQSTLSLVPYNFDGFHNPSKLRLPLELPADSSIPLYFDPPAMVSAQLSQRNQVSTAVMNQFPTPLPESKFIGSNRGSVFESHFLGFRVLGGDTLSQIVFGKRNPRSDYDLSGFDAPYRVTSTQVEGHSLASSGSIVSSKRIFSDASASGWSGAVSIGSVSPLGSFFSSASVGPYPVGLYRKAGAVGGPDTLSAYTNDSAGKALLVGEGISLPASGREVWIGLGYDPQTTTSDPTGERIFILSDRFLKKVALATGVRSELDLGASCEGGVETVSSSGEKTFYFLCRPAAGTTGNVTQLVKVDPVRMTVLSRSNVDRILGIAPFGPPPGQMSGPQTDFAMLQELKDSLGRTGLRLSVVNLPAQGTSQFFKYRAVLGLVKEVCDSQGVCQYVTQSMADELSGAAVASLNGAGFVHPVKRSLLANSKLQFEVRENIRNGVAISNPVPVRTPIAVSVDSADLTTSEWTAFGTFIRRNSGDDFEIVSTNYGAPVDFNSDGSALQSVQTTSGTALKPPVFKGENLIYKDSSGRKVLRRMNWSYQQ